MPPPSRALSGEPQSFPFLREAEGGEAEATLGQPRVRQ